ncbi:MAG: UDP-N-acetylglucosamine 2-epimerase (non-hydrolyzing) [Actinobacteria bacterium]|nr:MAG: UDP-N-acetylglucosamine 2-epimerase (non-hydrolyzing) [Actinomycetota bacterium]
MSAAIAFVVGARPNFMKTAPVYRGIADLAPQLELLLVHTGQHYDADMSDVFFRDLDLPTPDVVLGVASGTHAEQTARALVGIERILLAEKPALVVVCGDVNSTLAGALAAVKLHIPVAHIEAGLRSRDREMPEEHNRRVADHLSTLLFAHSSSAVENLESEGIFEGVHLVGNTMIDSLLAHLGAALAARPWVELGVEQGSYLLVTLHRPSLVDDADCLTATAHGLTMLADRLDVVFPVHPRTKARLEQLGLGRTLRAAGVVVTPPLGYLAFLGLQAEALAVLTDSGGVQEETSALGVRCFTLRDTTERPVTVELGTNTLLGRRPERIPEILDLLSRPCTADDIPLWDGHAGRRAAAVLAAAVEPDIDAVVDAAAGRLPVAAE